MFDETPTSDELTAKDAAAYAAFDLAETPATCIFSAQIATANIATNLAGKFTLHHDQDPNWVHISPPTVQFRSEKVRKPGVAVDKARQKVRKQYNNTTHHSGTSAQVVLASATMLTGLAPPPAISQHSVHRVCFCISI